MFAHLLAGCLVFLLFGENTRLDLIIGALWAISPDLISSFLSPIRFDKWCHAHRDNFSHSIFFPIVIFLFGIFINSKMIIMGSAAMLTHPFLDLFGMGWGVKLFYPLISETTYKLFYKGKFLTRWTPERVRAEAEKFGDNHWIRNIYFTPNLIGFSEWLSLILFLSLIFF